MKRSILLAFVTALMLAVGVGGTATADSGAQASAKKQAAKKKAAKCNTKSKAKGKAKGKARKSLASDAAKKKGKKKASKCKAKPKKKTAKPKAKPPAPTVPPPAPAPPLPGAGFGDGSYKDATTGVTIKVTGQVVEVGFPLPGGSGCLGGPLVGGDGPLSRGGGKARSNGIIDGSIFSVQWDLVVDEATLDYELATVETMQAPPCQHAATFKGKLAKQ